MYLGPFGLAYIIYRYIYIYYIYIYIYIYICNIHVYAYIKTFHEMVGMGGLAVVKSTFLVFIFADRHVDRLFGLECSQQFEVLRNIGQAFPHVPFFLNALRDDSRYLLHALRNCHHRYLRCRKAILGTAIRPTIFLLKRPPILVIRPLIFPWHDSAVVCTAVRPPPWKGHIISIIPVTAIPCGTAVAAAVKEIGMTLESCIQAC
jgi:hypothetical protein